MERYNNSIVPSIGLERVTKSYKQSGAAKVPAVRELSLEIENGGWLVLAGPSGSGKSTTLRLIAGLECPDEGTIRFDGEVVNEVPAGKRDVAMVFQSLALYPHMSARENIVFGLKVRGFSRAEIERRVAEVLEVLKLKGCEGKRPDQLSGGERQRVAVARALARRPSILLFDEPLSNLDTPLRFELRREFGKLRGVYNGTVIYVTHDQGDAMVLGDRIALLQHGELQQVGRPDEIYSSPANLFVAGFFGNPQMNLVEGTLKLEDGRRLFEARGVRIPLVLSEWRGNWCGAVVLGIRPEHVTVRIKSHGGMGETAPGVVGGKVLRVQNMGSEKHVTVETACGELMAIVRDNGFGVAGQSVELVLDLARVSLFEVTGGRRLPLSCAC